MGKLYCIYTDKEFDASEMSREHIIPLSLGGCDKFSIMINKLANNQLGTKIDGQFASDFLISSIRRRKNYVGHSGKTPQTIIKKTFVKETDRPLQLVLSSQSPKFYDPISSSFLTDKDAKGLEFTSSMKFDKHIRVRFIAKALLSAGYFIHENDFREHADHASLRTLLHCNFDKNNAELLSLPIGIINVFNIDEEDKGYAGICNLICQLIDDSCVIFHTTPTQIVGSVGIGGKYQGSIRIEANTTKFSQPGRFDLGIVIGIQKGQIKWNSFCEMVEIVNSKLPLS